jgi:hypothetical protein
VPKRTAHTQTERRRPVFSTSFPFPLPSPPPPPPPLSLSLPLLQFLEDNERLIQAVAALFAAGRGGEAGAYQARLHANLMWLAAVADCSGGGGGGGG